MKEKKSKKKSKKVEKSRKRSKKVEKSRKKSKKKKKKKKQNKKIDNNKQTRMLNMMMKKLDCPRLPTTTTDTTPTPLNWSLGIPRTESGHKLVFFNTTNLCCVQMKSVYDFYIFVTLSESVGVRQHHFSEFT